MQQSEGTVRKHRGNPDEPLQCAACRSTWFHELSVTEYVVKSGRWMEAHPGPFGVLVCLCGALQRPRLTGQRETARQMLESFTTSFDLAEDVHRLDDIAEKYGSRLLPSGVDYDGRCVLAANCTGG